MRRPRRPPPRRLLRRARPRQSSRQGGRTPLEPLRDARVPDPRARRRRRARAHDERLDGPPRRAQSVIARRIPEIESVVAARTDARVYDRYENGDPRSIRRGSLTKDECDPRGAPYEGVPLEVHYKFLRKTLYLWIPIPSGYSSGLTKKLREERPPYNDLAYVQIDSRKRDKAHTPPGKENEAERLRNNYLYLEWFYVRPQQFRGDSTSTERASLAGLGKKLLCAAIFLMVEKGFVTDPATAVIGLEAGGGHCEMSKDSKKRKALTMSDEDLRKYLLQHKATNRYVEVTTKKMKTEEDKAKFRRTTVCEIEDNRELAGYYRHQYGFEIFDDSNGLGFLMEAPLMTVIGNCGDTYRRPDALPDLTAAHALPATRTTRSASRAPTAARTPAPVPVPTQAARALTRRIRAPPPQLPPPPPPPPPPPVPVRRPARKRKQPPARRVTRSQTRPRTKAQTRWRLTART
eukprot:jgi/Mesvir1/22306/Mv02063-RA.1